MKAPRSSWLAAGLGIALLASFPRPSAAQMQYTGAARNVSIKLTLPDGVAKVRTVLTFTVRGLASGWASSASFKDLAKRMDAGIATVSGGDDLNDNSYPNRCASGEFNGIGEAFDKLAMASNHPELANVPLVGLGHSHGGDYWNWYNACHPERMAMVFVHASGGVNYSAAALKVPVFYTLGTGDLVERGSGKPRAGMWANRAKGAPMTLVIGVGGHDTQFGAEEYQIVTALIEAIVKMRIPGDADPAKGPVKLYDIVEGDSTWVGDLYTKEISTYSTFKGNKALTSFLPNQALAMMWKPNGPGLPTSIMLPTTGPCGWCGTPKDEPKATPNPPPNGALPPPTDPPDAGAGPSADAGSGSSPPTTTADASTSTPTPTPGPTPTPAPTPAPKRDAAPAPTPDPVDEPVNTARHAGGCSLATAPGAGALPALLSALAIGLAARKRRQR
jgi:MYXO-CTERM domain-containing protein